jgi:hypothetical protein
VLGDTLIENKGVPADYRFPAKLEFALRAKGHSVAVVNAGLVTDSCKRSCKIGPSDHRRYRCGNFGIRWE